ncbi:hypothetical protein [Helicobacter sp. 10-6591]|uniref:hypothetical protein n=1 Tax=Helicobacter sp. 10-6591 TaxID=2004998 RepID=UPI00215C8794|nr:hypothetical protein [Helicobacter sp. 10-6591]MCI7485538.1 hypothetical protein [Helicobacter sp.]
MTKTLPPKPNSNLALESQEKVFLLLCLHTNIIFAKLQWNRFSSISETLTMFPELYFPYKTSSKALREVRLGRKHTKWRNRRKIAHARSNPSVFKICQIMTLE